MNRFARTVICIILIIFLLLRQESAVGNDDSLHNFNRIYSIRYSSDGSRLFIAGYRTVWLGHTEWAFAYDAATFRQLFIAPPPKPNDRSFASSANRVVSDVQNRFIVTAGQQNQVLRGYGNPAGESFGQIKVWDAKSFHFLRELDHANQQFLDAAISPDGKLLAAVCSTSGFNFSTVWIWRLDSGKRVKKFVGHRQLEIEPGKPPEWSGVMTTAVAFSPDGKTLATGGRDSQIRFWDVENDFAELAAIDCGSSSPERLIYFPNGTRLVSAGSDGVAIIWDIHERKPSYTLKLKNQKYWEADVAISPDGKTIATADHVEVRLWDSQSGTPLRRLKLPYTDPTCVAYSPCGRYLAIGFDKYPRLRDGGSDGVIQWDLVGDKLRQPVK
jgi:WD40 repeat protein